MVENKTHVLEIFKLYMKTTTESNSGYFFEWIRKCILDAKTDKAELVEELTRNIDKLIQWDREQVRDIVMRLPNQGTKLVFALESFPELQLTYLERLMERSRNPSEGVSDDTKLKFLERTCQLRPDTVVSILKNYIFPLESSLKICERYHNLHGQAHIKSRTRNIESAITIYMQIMKESLYAYLDNPKSLPPSKLSSQLSEAMFAYQMIDETCKKETEEMFEEGVKYFDQFVNFLIDTYKEFDEMEEAMTLRPEETFVRYLQLMKFLKIEIFDVFLIVYITRVGTKRFVEILKKKLGGLRIKEIQEFMSALNNEEEMIFNITDNSKDDFNISRLQSLSIKRRARQQMPECAFCGDRLHLKSVVTKCVHSFCLKCVKDLFPQPKDIVCPFCNSYMNLMSKLHNCLSETPQSTLVSLAASKEADKDATPTAAGSAEELTYAERSQLEQMKVFDQHEQDLVKFSENAENMIIFGNITYLFGGKKR